MSPAIARYRVAAALDAAPPGPVGLAVSGGSDSTALLLLARDWAEARGREIAAITVDHGLRPEAAGEAEAVARLCARLGVPHAIRSWNAPSGRGNLQARAREARRALIAAWAGETGIAAVALGHTLDDQAETVLLRLARGSGVDGLSAMAPSVQAEGTLWLRPLLGLRREALRSFLRAEGIAWAEDPSNTDANFDRVRARALLESLGDLGLSPERLAATASAMGRARRALTASGAALASAALRSGRYGEVEMEVAVLSNAPRDLADRVLAGTLCWVAGARYRPRYAALSKLQDALAAGRIGRGASLHGCLLRPLRSGAVSVRREPAAMMGSVPAETGRWDGRWSLSLAPGRAEGLTLGALGRSGVAELGKVRPGGVPAEVLASTPALREGSRLVAAPVVRPLDWVSAHMSAPLPAPWECDDLALNPTPQGLC